MDVVKEEIDIVGVEVEGTGGGGGGTGVRDGGR